MKYVFGPVASRRLKRSLGIDLVPYKTCSLDCIYCEVGKTTNLTVERTEYLPTAIILANLTEYLQELPSPPDYITLSGSGEPTLHAQIGTIIKEIKGITSIPVAVLTNGTLLYRDEVKEALLQADVVLPSLDAVSEAMFRSINRPHSSLKIGTIIRGLHEFRRSFGGQVWLEVLLCRGINDDEEEIARLKETINTINPDKVQLNTVDRPPVEDLVFPVDREALTRIQGKIGERAEVVAGSVDATVERMLARGTMRIVELLRRRPGTVDDISRALRLHSNEVERILDTLKTEGKVQPRMFNNRWYYHAE